MDSKTTKMIPEKTLEIIREETAAHAGKLMPIRRSQMWLSGFMEGSEFSAKRGYELAMGDRWIEIKEGCEMPIYGSLILVYDERDDYTGCCKYAGAIEIIPENYTHWQYSPSPPKPKP